MASADTVVLHSGAGAMGNGVAINVEEYATCAIVLEKVVGKIEFQGSVDGDTYKPILAYNQETGALTTTTDSSGNYTISTAGLMSIRAVAGAGSIIKARRSVEPSDLVFVSKLLRADIVEEPTQDNILQELKKMNVHLALITGIELDQEV